MTNPDWDHPPVTLGRLLPLLVPGLAGTAAAVQALRHRVPDLARAAGIAPGTVVLLAASLPVLVVVAAVAGLHAAPRTGFTSRVQDRIDYGTEMGPGLRADLVPAAVAGLVAGGIPVGLARWTPAPAPALGALTRDELLAGLPAAVLHGALVEELVLRWGLVTVLALGLTVLVHRRQADPSTPVVAAAVVLAAAVSALVHPLSLAALHGPVAAASNPWTLGAHAAAALVLGLVFWRQSLEAAMMAHGLAHVVLVAGLLAGLPAS